MSVPILSFVGRSNSGKTTLIERVIPELVRAGYKVATVKHAGHGFDLDTEGKDSWRHKQAGASSVGYWLWCPISLSRPRSRSSTPTMSPASRH